MYENIGTHYIINGVIDSAVNYKKRVYIERIYEVIRLIDSEPLYLNDHFSRLQKSAYIIDRELPLSAVDLKRDLSLLIKTEQIYNNNIMLICYYGNNHSWYIIYYRKSKYPSEQMYKEGVKTGLMRLERNVPNAKILDVKYRDAVMAEINKKNFFEVILVNKEGMICEGSKSNIFFYKDNKYFTPPAEIILEGITRKHVIKKINENGYYFEEAHISEHELHKFDGAFLTSTSIGVLPIKLIDDIQYKVGVSPSKLFV